MSTITRHPSAPRKTPPPPPRAPVTIPLMVCRACKDPVVPNVLPGPSWIVTIALMFMAVVPAILYLIYYEMLKKRAVTCPRCGRPDVVPLDSTAGREILGERFDAVVAAGMKMGRAAQAKQQASRRATERAVLVGLCVAGVLAVGGIVAMVVVDMRHAQAEEIAAAERKAEAEMRAKQDAAREAERAQGQEARFRDLMAGPGLLPDGGMFAPVQVTIATDGVAHERPDAKAPASWKLTAGEKYRLEEERDGWVRIEADVPAWVEASNVNR